MHSRRLMAITAAGLALACPGLRAEPAAAPTASRSPFENQPPAGWQMSTNWSFTPAGARADGDCRAVWQRELPAQAMLEIVLELPSAERLERPVTATLTLGSETDRTAQITVAADFRKTAYTLTLTGPATNAKPETVTVRGDTRPAVALAWKEAETNTGWAGRTISLTLVPQTDGCRLLLNGCASAELATPVPAARRVTLRANGITLKTIGTLPAPPSACAGLSGGGLALLNGGTQHAAARGIQADDMQLQTLVLDGLPFAVLGAGGGQVRVLDVNAERWKSEAWSEGKGLLTAGVPPRPYARAALLIHRTGSDPAAVPALGFGLRAQERAAGDLKNVYVGEVPLRCSDAEVTVQPVPELGDGWFLARMPLNPAALHGYTHDVEDRLFPRGKPAQFLAYVARTWTSGGGIPHPAGGRSALEVAAITLEEAGFDLTVKGNGLGNVYEEPARPALTGTLTNLTDAPLTIRVTVELFPYEREPASRNLKIKLAPRAARSFDALAAAIRERGHYRVRVAADAGAAGRVDYRTNVGLLAPDTRKKIDSPFGCWSVLWGDTATSTQRVYLRDKAGIGFIMGTNAYDVRMGVALTNDVATELVKKAGPEVRIFMLGWEHTWSMEQTFAFPRVIAEGKPEELSATINTNIDRLAADWRKLAATVRKLRPDVKISLGNSAVNFSVPLLERGFKPGVEFDDFGTEEGLFDETPEQPADAIGNINWWVEAVMRHFGLPKVPIFHSESVYYSTGPAFARMAERTQAGNYVREFMLGFPYDSIFGFSGAMVDSGNQYIYSIWGTAGHCNQAPECSPKLSFTTLATLTQLLDGARYGGRLDTGTTSLYALRFVQPGGAPLYALWNLRGARRVTAAVKAGSGRATVIDALNRGRKVRVRNGKLELTLSDLPIYVKDVELDRIEGGENVAAESRGRLVDTLTNVAAWRIDAEPDAAFEAPREWRGMPKVMGKFEVAFAPDLVPPGTNTSGAVTFTLQPLAGKHGLIPRYVSLTAAPAQAVPLPKGTTQLGVWVYGHSTWAQVKLGVQDASGKSRLILADDNACRMADNFDGWRFLQTGELGDDIAGGGCKLNRLVVTMPEQQVYVDELVTTAIPQITVYGLCAADAPLRPISYLPW